MNTPETVPLTLAEARDVLFWTFFMSQGNTVLHMELLRYVAQHRPLWRLPHQQQAALHHLIEAAILGLVAHEDHQFVGADVIESDLTSQIGVFAWLLNGPRRLAPNANEVNLRHIVRRLIKEDGRFLGCPASQYPHWERRCHRFRFGERRARAARMDPPLLDTFFSFVCFALLGRPLCGRQVIHGVKGEGRGRDRRRPEPGRGGQVIIDLMAEVRQVFLERGHTWRKAMAGHEALFAQIAAVWNDHHPSRRVDPSLYLPTRADSCRTRRAQKTQDGSLEAGMSNPPGTGKRSHRSGQGLTSSHTKGMIKP